MALYFLLLDADLWGQTIQPALAACVRARSFAPCQELVRGLVPAAEAFAQSHGLGESPLVAVARGLPFDRTRWQLLAGEILWFIAAEVPEVPTALEATTWLVTGAADDAALTREAWPPLRQAYRGAHDVRCGPATYAADQAGLNGLDDIERISIFLARIDPATWTPDRLKGWQPELDAEELAEEVDCAREWFPGLVEVYRRAAECRQIVVCEEV